MFRTGVRAIDLLPPLERGGKAGLLGGAGVGKTMLVTELNHNVIERQRGASLFCGIGERWREAEEPYRQIRDAGVLDRTVMAFGQMNEPPGARFRVGLAALRSQEWSTRCVPSWPVDRRTLLSALAREYLFVWLYRAHVDALASEHAGRLASMRAAQRHIAERLDEFGMTCRRQRQTAITSELMDAVSGFEALSGEGEGERFV